VPVFFPAGSPVQIIIGLLVCFLSALFYGIYQPYIDDDDDLLAQMAQVTIFFSLIASLVTDQYPDNPVMSVMLPVVLATPIAIAIVIETPLFDCLRKHHRQIGNAENTDHAGSQQPARLKGQDVYDRVTTRIDRLARTTSAEHARISVRTHMSASCKSLPSVEPTPTSGLQPEMPARNAQAMTDAEARLAERRVAESASMPCGDLRVMQRRSRRTALSRNADGGSARGSSCDKVTLACSSDGPAHSSGNGPELSRQVCLHRVRSTSADGRTKIVSKYRVKRAGSVPSGASSDDVRATATDSSRSLVRVRSGFV